MLDDSSEDSQASQKLFFNRETERMVNRLAAVKCSKDSDFDANSHKNQLQIKHEKWVTKKQR